MPVVKSYRQSVEPAPLAGGKLTAAPTPESLGGDIGKSVAGIGLQLYEDEILRQDQVAFLEADRKLSEWENNALYHPQTGALGKRGKDSLGLHDQVGTDYQRAADEIRKGLGNERQRVAFDRSVSVRRKDINSTISRHTFNEMRKFEEAETENYIANSTQAAILNNHDPERIALELERAKAAVAGFARRNGMGAEYVKQKTAQIVSNTHVGIVERYLSNGQDQSAKQYFDRVKPEIAGDDVAKVEAKLNVAVVEGEGMRAATDIWRAMGPRRDLDPVNLDAMVEDARTKFGSNPKLLKAVSDAIKERANLHNSAQRERLEASESAVWQAYERGANLATIRRMPEYIALPGQAQARIKEHVIDRADLLKRRAEGEGDDTLYYNLLTEASSAPLQEKFVTTNLMEHHPKLSKAQFNHLAEVQAALRKGDTKASDKLLASERLQKQIVDEALLSMKLDPTPSERTSKTDIERINGFRRSVREAVRSQETRTGKNATDAEVQSIVDGMVIRGVTAKGVLWDTTKRVYELKPGETIAIKAADVPRAERAKIEDSLRRAGKPATDEAIVRLYTARLLQLRGIDAANEAAGRVRR